MRALRVDKVFASNARPLLLALFGAPARGRPPSAIICKRGDDLRQDVAVLACARRARDGLRGARRRRAAG